MLNAILGLFTSFNPIIVGLMLSAGAYIVMRHRVLPPIGALGARVGRTLALAGASWRHVL